jgi:hypothetical protein
VVLEPDPGTDPEDRERLGRQLRNKLRGLDVDEVSPVTGAPAPDGSKSGAAASLTEWLVTLSSGGGVFVTVIATIKDWLSLRDGARWRPPPPGSWGGWVSTAGRRPRESFGSPQPRPGRRSLRCGLRRPPPRPPRASPGWHRDRRAAGEPAALKDVLGR